MTIAIDFDGTVVEHRYPAIGEEIPFATDTLKALIRDGHRLILWTVREGELLDEAARNSFDESQSRAPRKRKRSSWWPF